MNHWPVAGRYTVISAMPSPLKSPEWMTGFTVSRNDVGAVRLPSLTVTVIVAVPIVPA